MIEYFFSSASHSWHLGLCYCMYMWGHVTGCRTPYVVVEQQYIIAETRILTTLFMLCKLLLWAYTHTYVNHKQFSCFFCHPLYTSIFILKEKVFVSCCYYSVPVHVQFSIIIILNYSHHALTELPYVSLWPCSITRVSGGEGCTTGRAPCLTAVESAMLECGPTAGLLVSYI